MHKLPRNRLSICAVVAALLLPGASPAFGAAEGPVRLMGGDAERIAMACVHHVRALTGRAVERNRAIARECVPEIEALVEAGRIEEAEELAAQCTRAVVHGSNDRLRHLRRDCVHCIRVLLFLRAPDLAELVARVCEAASDRIEHSKRAAVMAIREALEG